MVAETKEVVFGGFGWYLDVNLDRVCGRYTCVSRI